MRPAPAVISTGLFASTTGFTFDDGHPITEDEVLAAQKAWCDALIAVAKAHDAQGLAVAREVATAAVTRLYNYANGPVLFKPTLAAEPHRFRTTERGAISYFVGGDPDFPADSGFGLKGWREAVVTNAAIFIEGSVGISMGDVTFTDKAGNTVSVDKTWGFQKLDNGAVVIVLHHSSLPYTG